LQPQQVVLAEVLPILSTRQREWFRDYLFKSTIAAISYEKLRGEAVHDFFAHDVTFSKVTVDGKPVPDLNFDLLYSALLNIFSQEKSKSIKTNAWPWEQ